MRLAGLFALALLSPTFAYAAVSINEIAWMGTTVSANAEWIELVNSGGTAVDLTGWQLTALSGSPSISLAGSISANGYFLLERTSDASVPAVPADQIYTGALTNTGTTLTLSDADGATVDEVIGGTNWANIGGDNASKETAQRTASGWETAAATPRVANAGVSATPADTESDEEDEATTTPSSAGTPPSVGTVPPEYAPIPVLRVLAGGDRVVSSSADTAFTAVVYDHKGNRRDDALVTWSFGDGMQRVGASVFHAYYDPGEYVVVVHASTIDGGDAFAKSIISVQDANIKITSVSPRGVTIANNSSRALDLSSWRLSAGGKEFKMPADTQILAGRTVLFSARVTGLPAAEAASLLYPSGDIAATYPATITAQPPVSSAQPLAARVSLNNTVQTVRLGEAPARQVESVRTNDVSGTAHADTRVAAPVATTQLAAAGAAFPPAPATPIENPPGMNLSGPSFFKSPWVMSFLGVMALAGGAFIFL